MWSIWYWFDDKLALSTIVCVVTVSYTLYTFCVFPMMYFVLAFCSSNCNGRGTCVAPETCRCHDNNQYIGRACETRKTEIAEPLSLITSKITNSKWGNKKVCFCFTAVCNPRCEHGRCDRPNSCVCHEGYTGSRCDQRKSFDVL